MGKERGEHEGTTHTISRREIVASARRVVVKVGSTVLSKGDPHLHLPTITRLAREICELRQREVEVVLVSSGAILAGMSKLGLERWPHSIPLKQAAAATGQSELMRAYEEACQTLGQKVAQVLLTQEDFRHRQRYLNARNTLSTLLHLSVLPIINENDTVAVEEIRVGDNDILSALVATLVGADLLVILTDTDGLFTADPRREVGARLIPLVTDTAAGGFSAGRSHSGLGTGGMSSKVDAAHRAALSGIPTIIANGLVEGTLRRIWDGGEVGTLFLPSEVHLRSRKRWLAFATHPRGVLTVDAGAKRALIEGGKSLLPSGVVGITERFEAGDVVSVVGPDRKEFARGLTNYGDEEIRKIRGRKSAEIVVLLGYKSFDEVIHRDNLVILAKRER